MSPVFNPDAIFNGLINEAFTTTSTSERAEELLDVLLGGSVEEESNLSSISMQKSFPEFAYALDLMKEIFGSG